MSEVGIQYHFLPDVYSVVPTSLLYKPFPLTISNATFIIYYMLVYMLIYLWQFGSITLNNLSSYAPASHCFNYYSIVMWFNIGLASSLLLSFFSIVLILLACLFFHMNFRNRMSTSKNSSSYKVNTKYID